MAEPLNSNSRGLMNGGEATGLMLSWDLIDNVAIKTKRTAEEELKQVGGKRKEQLLDGAT